MYINMSSYTLIEQHHVVDGFESRRQALMSKPTIHSFYIDGHLQPVHRNDYQL